MRAALLIAALFGAAACAPSPSQSPKSMLQAPTAQPNVQVLAERLAMPGLGRERTLRLYLPPSYAASPQRRYPVIYMHDAQNLFDDATSFVGERGVDETMNQLARSHGFEAIVVGIDHGGDRRTQELLPWPHPRFPLAEGDAYIAFLVEVVKPFIDSRYRTRPEASATALAGSSLGGLISQVALHRHPNVFGRAAVFSPAYWVAPQIDALARDRPLPASARVYLYAGDSEDDEMLPMLRRVDALLAQGNAALRLQVVAGAKHNEAAWRAEFARAVVWLFELEPTQAK